MPQKNHQKIKKSPESFLKILKNPEIPKTSKNFQKKKKFKKSEKKSRKNHQKNHKKTSKTFKN